MGEKITRENRKFKFETLQLHVGQEQPDPVTDAYNRKPCTEWRAYRSSKEYLRWNNKPSGAYTSGIRNHNNIC